MWFIFTLLQSFFLALVNYTDEYLTTKNKVPASSNMHTRIGGQLLMSALVCFLGAIFLWLIIRITYLPTPNLLLSLLSSVPLISTFAIYFYLLLKYPIHQVGPIFQLSSSWLLLFDALTGKTIPAWGLVGVLVLVYGSWILDSGTFKFRLPSRLLVWAIPGTLSWSLAIYLVKIASTNQSAEIVSFWQLVGCGLVGTILLIFVKRYRDGLLFRLKNQGRSFLGLSLLNETFSETAFFFSNLAVALAPVTAYVTAMSGIQSLFLLLIVYFFPLNHRNTIKPIQWAAILLIFLGTVLINL